MSSSSGPKRSTGGCGFDQIARCAVRQEGVGLRKKCFLRSSVICAVWTAVHSRIASLVGLPFLRPKVDLARVATTGQHYLEQRMRSNAVCYMHRHERWINFERGFQCRRIQKRGPNISVITRRAQYARLRAVRSNMRYSRCVEPVACSPMSILW